MSSIVLFRYDRDYPVCRQALKALRALNPGLAIHGLYGGDRPGDLPDDLTTLLDGNWTIPGDDHYHKWKDGDLCVRDWYAATGRHLAFDHLYLIEWDMLFLKPLAALYGPLAQGANYGTFLAKHRYADVRDWFFLDQHRYEVEWMLKHLEKNGLPVPLDHLSFGKMCGVVFCRAFLDRFGAAPVPSYSNDEVRFSVYSAAFGIPLLDNRIGGDPRNIFHVDGETMLGQAEVETVHARGGAFLHPVRTLIDGLDAMLTA